MEATLYGKVGGTFSPVIPQTGNYWQETDGTWRVRCPYGEINLSEYDIILNSDKTITIEKQISYKGRKWRLVKGELFNENG